MRLPSALCLLCLLCSLLNPAPLAAQDPPPALAPTLLMELDHRVYPADEEGLTGFALGRLRPGLVLQPARWMRGVATIEYAGKNPIILDAFARFKAKPWLDVTTGYSKPPLFASFIYEPVYSLPFPDRAPVVGAFRVRRDLGVDAHFMPASLPLEGWLRVGNGTGSPLGNDNALPAGYASLDLVLGRAHHARAGAADEALGLRLGASGLLERSADRDAIAGQTPMGFVYYRPAIVSGRRAVGEAHAVGYAGPLRLTVEGAAAHEQRDDDGDPDTPRVALPAVTSYGLTAELVWTLYGGWRRVARAPLPSADQWGQGVLEVGARYDGMWLGRGADDIEPGGSQGGAVAIKWWPTSFLAAALAGYVTRYYAAPVERPDALWSWDVLARASVFWGY